MFSLFVRQSVNQVASTGQQNLKLTRTVCASVWGRCNLYLLASPSLPALHCVSLEGFLARQAATGQHIVKAAGVRRYMEAGLLDLALTPPSNPHLATHTSVKRLIVFPQP